MSSSTSDKTSAPVLPYETPPIGERRWHAGTLTYTSAGLVTLFIWLLGGDFTWQLRDRSIAPMMPLLIRKFGGSDFAAGVFLATLPALLGMILAPIISYKSDRHRGRFGRRIPFILYPTPIAFIALVAVGFSPEVGRKIHNLLGPATFSVTASILATFAVFWTTFEVAAITINAVHGALINDVVPRPVMGKFFGLFRMLSLGAGILFNWFLLGKVENHYQAMFIGIGLLYAVAFTLMCLNIREGEYPPPPPVEKSSWFRDIRVAVVEFLLLRRKLSAFLLAWLPPFIRGCFTRPYYLWYFLSFALAMMAFTPINLFSMYYRESVGMSLDAYGKFSAVQFVCSMLQAPIIGWLADKFHPIRVTIAALLIYGVVTFIAFFFVRNWGTFAAAHVICGTCSGIWLTATAPLSPLLLPRMKFATYASALGICSAIGSMITGPLVGRWLDFLNLGSAGAARDYHYIYLWACCFILASLAVMMVVYRYFMSYGGPQNYVAPDDDEPILSGGFPVSIAK